MAAGVEEGDEGGQFAVTDSAQGQGEAVRGDAAQHQAKRKMLAGSDRDRGFAKGKRKTDDAEKNGQQADRGHSPLLIEDDAKRSA